MLNVNTAGQQKLLPAMSKKKESSCRFQAQKHFGIQIENYPYEKTFPLYKREYKELRWFAEFDDVFSEKNTGISVYLRDIIKELLITRMECDL